MPTCDWRYTLELEIHGCAFCSNMLVHGNNPFHLIKHIFSGFEEQRKVETNISTSPVIIGKFISMFRPHLVVTRELAVRNPNGRNDSTACVNSVVPWLTGWLTASSYLGSCWSSLAYFIVLLLVFYFCNLTSCAVLFFFHVEMTFIYYHCIPVNTFHSLKASC